MKIMLAIVMCFIFSAPILWCQTATEPIGDGSIGNKYQIASLENLYWIAGQVNGKTNDFFGKYFIQTSDIDASATNSWPGGKGWTPIGNFFNLGYSFSGNYDGQHHTISNITIKSRNSDCIGLFGFINAATIKNLGITNVSITAEDASDQWAGGLVGFGYESTIDSCYATGSISCTMSAGGLIGSNGAESLGSNTVTNCYAHCTVSSSNTVGGLFAESYYGTVSNCYSEGSVTGTGYCSNIGGLIGNNTSSLDKCFSSCSVVGGTGQSVGGLIGYNYGNVSNSYARSLSENRRFTKLFAEFARASKYYFTIYAFSDRLLEVLLRVQTCMLVV